MDFFDPSDPEIKSRLIYEDDLVFAFPTKSPIVPGHILICPKRPVSNFEDLTSEELLAMFSLLKRLKPVMKSVFSAEGFNYAWNEEKNAGQSVPHMHIHMVPRKPSDAGIVDYEPRKFLYRPGVRPDSLECELSKIAELVRQKI